jgi:hypothetical protein
MEVSGQLHDSAASPPGILTTEPSNWRLCELQSWYGEEKDLLPLPGIERRSSSQGPSRYHGCSTPQSHHDDMVTCEQTSPSIMVSSPSFLHLCCASKGKVVPVFTYTSTRLWRRMGTDLDTSLRWVVSGTPGTHWIGGWVDARTGLDDVEKRKFLTLPRLELEPSVVQPVASRYTENAI